jgi:succinoglycan biosynthesis protein ExoW
MPGNIAVVIPHFQRTSGVLARTLAGIFAQTGTDLPTVIVVDDESPAPAAAELSGLDDAARAAIRLIEQKNRGPAAARNVGLAAIPPGTEYVALSDCDDIWRPQHLARGMAAMRLGYDLFFSDHRREGSDKTRFEQCGIHPYQHELIDEKTDLYRWQTDLFDATLHTTILGFSTVLFRRSAFPGLKFAEDVEFGDDYIFALEVARGTSKIACTFSEDVFYTAADNISLATDWRSNKALRHTLTLSLCYHKTLKEFSVTAAQREFLNRRIRQIRRDFATTMIGMLLRARKIESGYVTRFVRTDPALLGEIPASALRTLLRTPSGMD